MQSSICPERDRKRYIYICIYLKYFVFSITCIWIHFFPKHLYHIENKVPSTTLVGNISRYISIARIKRAKITRRPNGIKSTHWPVICENVRLGVAATLRPGVCLSTFSIYAASERVKAPISRA